MAKITEVVWNEAKTGLPKSSLQEIHEGNYDFPAYILWCRDENGRNYIPYSSFVLEAELKDGIFEPTQWVGYQGGEFACTRELDDVLWWAKMPQI